MGATSGAVFTNKDKEKDPPYPVGFACKSGVTVRREFLLCLSDQRVQLGFDVWQFFTDVAHQNLEYCMHNNNGKPHWKKTFQTGMGHGDMEERWKMM